jgi:hypothetical protein
MWEGDSVIVVFGGVQIDRPGLASPRFPDGQVDDVADRVRRLLASLQPRMVVGAAASGADLIILGEAVRLNVEPRIVLPFPVDRFEQTSVASRGPEWVRRYRHVIEARRDKVEILDEVEDDDVYLRTNGRLIERGRELAADGEGLIVLVLRPADNDGGSVTDDLARRAELAGLLVLDLDCRRPAADRPSAFVAMPYGKKRDPQTGVEINCDLVFHQIYLPVLEDLDFRAERSDRRTDTGIVHVSMIDAIANSDLVVADLATLNPNVLYEVGLRHALADKVTVLTVPDFGRRSESQRLFDLSFIRQIPYQRGVDGLTDQQVIDSMRALRTVLADATAPGCPVDSPVFTWFERASAGLRARAGTTHAAQREIELWKEAEAAMASGRPSDLIAVARQLDGPDVPLGIRQSIRLELAIALRERQAYEAAIELFETRPVPGGALRTLWLQQYALALRRRGEVEWRSGLDPEASWAAAKELLDELLSAPTPSAETRGIAGGLAKRRFQRFLQIGDRWPATAQLAQMITHYQKGFEAEPWDYYVGVNLLAGLRLRGQRIENSAEDLAKARDLVPVVRLMLQRIPTAGRNFWVEVTEAELVLHRYLLDDPAGAGPVDALVQVYSNALAGGPPPDARDSARTQLEICRNAGDPARVIDAVLAAFG